MKCEDCLNSRTVISENGAHHVCCLTDTQAIDCITHKYKHRVTLKKLIDESGKKEEENKWGLRNYL